MIGATLLIVFALTFATISAVAGLFTSRKSIAKSSASMCVLFLFAALVVLWRALLTDDFTNAYVAANSATTLPVHYKVSALWSSMNGSLLLWCWFLAGWTWLVARKTTGVASSILAATTAFFCGLSIFLANPFDLTAQVLSDGRGLNPLLQSPGMLIHPPVLYAGLTGMLVVFALSSQSITTGRQVAPRVTRTFMLATWMTLGVGLVLGGAWAYTELGWGGWWGWDPVENAALMPFLATTALIHTSRAQAKRGTFRLYNAIISALAACLALFGAFLTRSGLLSSVHTFSDSPVGRWLFVILAAYIVGAAAIILWKFDTLKSPHVEATTTTEGGFLVNNLLTLGILVVVFWGTVLPLVTEAITGSQVLVGPPFFNRIITPLGALLLIASGFGPNLTWGQRAWRDKVPLAALTSVAVGTAAGILTMSIPFGAIISAATFVIVIFVWSLKSTWQSAKQNPSAWGGYLAHVGLAILAIGVAGSFLKTQNEATLQPGESIRVANLVATYEGLERKNEPTKLTAAATVVVTKDSKTVTTLRPQLNRHVNFDQPSSEIAIRSTPIADLYLVLIGVNEFAPNGVPCDASTAASCQQVTLRIHHNPLVMWIWIGTGITMLGGLLALFGSRLRRKRPTPDKGPTLIEAPALNEQPAQTRTASTANHVRDVHEPV